MTISCLEILFLSVSWSISFCRMFDQSRVENCRDLEDLCQNCPPHPAPPIRGTSALMTRVCQNAALVMTVEESRARTTHESLVLWIAIPWQKLSHLYSRLMQSFDRPHAARGTWLRCKCLKSAVGQEIFKGHSRPLCQGATFVQCCYLLILPLRLKITP